MQPQRIVTGTSEEEIWQQLAPDFEEDNAILEYQAILDQSGRKVILDIDIDPGGGFEGGYATTSFSSPILNNNNFDLEMYKQTLFAEAGKLFGLEDVETGYAEIDKKFIVKTNNEPLVKEIFSDYSVRKLFEGEEDLELSTNNRKEDEEEIKFLELTFEDGITDRDRLKEIYTSFFKIISIADGKSDSTDYVKR